MKVSIITPVWNQYKITERFYMLNSIHLASYISDTEDDSIEFVVVNNGSEDDTPIKLLAWNIQFGDKFRIITLEKNAGFGPGHNKGAREAIGEILIHISNDVMPYGDYVETVVDAIKNDPTRLYGAKLFNQDTGWNSFDSLEESFIPYLEGWFIACHRDVWEKLGGFDERFVPCDYEDLDISYTAQKLGIEKVELPIKAKHFSGQTASKELSVDRSVITKKNRALFVEKWGLG